MKRVFALATSAVLALGLSGCFGPTEPTEPVTVSETVTETPAPEPAETVTETATPAPEPVAPVEPEAAPAPEAGSVEVEAFNATLDFYFTDLTDVDREAYLFLAQETCGALDRGATWDEIFEMTIQESQNTPNPDQFQMDTGYIMGAAVGTLCPQHSAGLTDYLEQGGV